jgi:hypothetical protein
MLRNALQKFCCFEKIVEENPLCSDVFGQPGDLVAGRHMIEMAFLFI